MTHFVAGPLDLDDTAILLDVDGTLLDIAATPHEVLVPESLRRILTRLLDRTDGALALVSGRRLADLDRIFAPLKLPAVGGHGAEIRLIAGGAIDHGPAAPLARDVRKRIAKIAALDRRIVIEDKTFSVAVHFRLVPEQGEAIRAAVEEIRAGLAPGELEVLPGKAVVEIKSKGFNKGMAVRRLMAHPPFRGRRPLFIGDDMTDEDAFAVLPEFNGVGLSVGRAAPGAAEFFDTPSEVRQWLEAVAGLEEAASS